MTHLSLNNLRELKVFAHSTVTSRSFQRTLVLDSVAGNLSRLKLNSLQLKILVRYLLLDNTSESLFVRSFTS